MHTPGGTSANCPPEHVTLYLLGAPSTTTAHVFRFAVPPNPSTVSGNASDRLKPESFYDPRNQIVYSVIQDMVLNNKPVDIATVAEELNRVKKLEEIGGPGYIAEISSMTATSANIEYHGSIVAQKAMARNFITIATKAITEAFDNPDDIEEIMQKAEEELAKLQLQLHADPNRPFVPRTYVFGAKAAAGYKTAKRIIELLLSMQDDINNDPFCKDKLQIYFVENYRVSAAEAIVPAAQVSEQISTAGKEASGTGCMKLMMNGAVTIGTLDGANVEMFEQLGPENMFLFGLHEDEISSWRASGYNPGEIARNDSELSSVLDRFSNGFRDGKSYSDLVSGLLYGGDPYMLIADFRSYTDTQDKLYARISDSSELGRLSIMNVAQSGTFSADRAIRVYADNIWHV